jgi:hypothetical protein
MDKNTRDPAGWLSRSSVDLNFAPVELAAAYNARCTGVIQAHRLQDMSGSAYWVLEFLTLHRPI